MKLPKIIAVDFDGTLCTNEWPAIGAANEVMISYLKHEQKLGAKLILWTCRSDAKLTKAVKWCETHGLIFDAVNENLPEVVEHMDGDTRKIFANVYIDDKSICPDIAAYRFINGGDYNNDCGRDEGRDNNSVFWE